MSYGGQGREREPESREQHEACQRLCAGAGHDRCRRALLDRHGRHGVEQHPQHPAERVPARVRQKGNALDPAIITPKEILRMLTVNGARSQRRHDCGVLAQGKRADLVVMDIDTPWMTPVHDIADQPRLPAPMARTWCSPCATAGCSTGTGEYETIDVEKAKAEVKRSVDEVLAAL